ncbi:MAG: tetratricopeptide repeat protein, partial [Alphaproteobacteria bacterium]|nr:tetratricopeptide repeat protein [Alphaproteobacteria bacterium]
HGMPMWRGLALVAMGWRSAREGEADAGIAMIRNGLAKLDAIGTMLWRPFNLLLLADAHLAQGTLDDALAAVDAALAFSTRQQELWLEPELHRRRAEILLRQGGRVGEAQACLETALAIARRRQTRSWELRAACDLARLLAEQGKRREAHDLVAGVYGWFTEGFATADLIAAKALLEDLQ